jgi:1-deoxy-D-xylulose-5-phosphate synthase
MLRTLPLLLEQDKPVLLHVVTQKGKGFRLAEGDPVKFHGLSAFEVQTGKTKPSPPSYTKIFGEALAEHADHDDRIVAITAAMPGGTGTNIFQERHPDRFFDMGIAEQCAVTFAGGLATRGMRPVCAIYSTFLQRAFDQVLHDIALQRLPVIFAMDRAGLVGADGAVHHGVFDLTYLRLIPNMTLMVPKDEAEMLHMLHTALQHTAGPIAFRYPRSSALGVPLPARGDLQVLPIGKSEVLSEGRDAMILATGHFVHQAGAVAAALSELGIDAGLVNMRFIKPLDEALLGRLAASNVPLFSLEDNTVLGGLGAAVNEFLAAVAPHRSACQILGIPDAFVTHGPIPALHAGVGLSPEQITARIAATLRDWDRVPSASEAAAR